MDQHTEQLKNYINTQLAVGLQPDEIKAQLVAVGWPAEMIEAGFVATQQSVLPTTMQPTPAAQAATPVTAPPNQPVEPTVAQTVQSPAQPTEHAVSSGMQFPVAENIPKPAANGKRRGRLKVSWLLLKQSVGVLKGNKSYLRYLLMTFVWIVALNVIFIGIFVGLSFSVFSGAFDNGNSSGLQVAIYVLVALSYVIGYFIVNLYAAGLAANMMENFNGKQQSFEAYMKFARSKWKPILTYSIIQATVGMFLEYVVERIRFVGWILSLLLGAMWSLLTMFTIPEIVTTDASAPKAIKQSFHFFRATWGENILAKITVNLPIFLLQLVVIVLFIPVAFVAGMVGWPLVVLAFIVFVFMLITLAVVSSFANSLINVSLYYYAKFGVVPPAFSAELLNQVFVPRKKGRFSRKKDQNLA